MIYDCFTFFNELDLLDIRLHELNKVVDKFVIVEATLTHQGKPKPLYFKENKDRFKKFSHKIIHIIVDSYPENKDDSAWIVENHQRNMILEGLKTCKSNDIIIISDLDEIPNPEKIAQYKNMGGIKIFRQNMYYYFLNCINTTNKKYTWNGSVMAYYKDMPDPQYMRNLAVKYMKVYDLKFPERFFWKIYYFVKHKIKGEKIIFINNGGWHFSYLGNVKTIIKKIESFAHSEFNKKEFKNIKAIEEAITSGQDIFGRGYQYRFLKIDRSFPAYIQQNQLKFSELIKKIQD